MLDQAKVVVTNTTPLIALTAATGGLDVLRAIYSRVIVPYLGEESVIQTALQQGANRRPAESKVLGLSRVNA